MQDVLTSSEFQGWQTPQWFLKLVRDVAPIALDPCTTEDNPTRAQKWAWLPQNDGLKFSWKQHSGGGLVFVNPPYGTALKVWANKMAIEAPRDTEMVILVPCRPDTAWYGTLASAMSVRLEWRGRITFVDPRAPVGMQWHEKKQCFVKATPAAFPCAVFYSGPNGARFYAAFAGRGRFCKDIEAA